MPRKQQQDRGQGIREVERDRENVQTRGREESAGEVPGLGRDVREGERGTQSDDSFVSRETERAGGGERQEPRRPGSLDRGRTASPHRSGSEQSSGRSGEQGVNQRISRGKHQEEESGLEEETSL